MQNETAHKAQESAKNVAERVKCEDQLHDAEERDIHMGREGGGIFRRKRHQHGFVVLRKIEEHFRGRARRHACPLADVALVDLHSLYLDLTWDILSRSKMVEEFHLSQASRIEHRTRRGGSIMHTAGKTKTRQADNTFFF